MKQSFRFLAISFVLLGAACNQSPAENHEFPPNPLLQPDLGITAEDNDIYNRVYQELNQKASVCGFNASDLSFFLTFQEKEVMSHLDNARRNWDALVKTYAKAGMRIEFALASNVPAECKLSEEALKYNYGATYALREMTWFVETENSLFDQDVIPNPRVQVIRIVLRNDLDFHTQTDPNSPSKAHVKEETLPSGQKQWVFDISVDPAYGFPVAQAGLLEALSTKY